MLSVAHGLTGAYFASLVPDQPLIYIPAAIAFHFLEDAVPHWDFGTGMRSGKKSKLLAYSLEIFDLILMAALIFLLWQHSLADPFYSPPWTAYFWQQIDWPIWLGALAGIVVDLLEFPHSALGLNLPFLKPLHDFHHRIHQSTTNIFFGLLPQVLVIISIIYLVILG